jgi:hypothetical protein
LKLLVSFFSFCMAEEVACRCLTREAASLSLLPRFSA